MTTLTTLIIAALMWPQSFKSVGEVAAACNPAATHYSTTQFLGLRPGFSSLHELSNDHFTRARLIQ